MRRLSRQIILPLLELAIAPIGAWVWFVTGSQLPTHAALSALTVGGLGVTILLALRFKRTAIGLLALAVFALWLLASATFDTSQGQLFERARWILAPWITLVVIATRAPLSSRVGFARAVAFVALGAALLRAPWPAGLPVLFRHVPVWVTPTAITSACSILLLAMYLVRRRETERAALVVLPTLFISLQATPVIHVLLGLSAATAVLVIAMMQSGASLAFRDELTGLPARRALNETLRGLKGNYALAMVDIDHFKKFNDRYGHQVGDEALRMVAGRVAEIRGGGKAFRYGGEEFAVVFSRMTANQAAPHLEQIRKEIASVPFFVRSSLRSKSKRKKPASTRRRKGIKVTVSIGVAGSARNKEPEQVLKLADKQLYRAKSHGRNQVCTKAATRR